MVLLLQMGPSKVLTTFPLQIQSSWQLSLLELSPCCVPACNTVTFPSDSSSLYTSTVLPGPHQLMQLSSPTLAFKLLILLFPSLFLFSLLPHHRLFLLAVLLRLLLPVLSPRNCPRFLQWNAGGLRARSTEMQDFNSSYPVDFSCIQESNLNSFSSFRIPRLSALRFDYTHSRSGILFRDATHASGGVIIFVRQGLSFSELSTSSLFSLGPYYDYVGVNISLNNSSSLLFLNVYAPPH